jgi:uncharacterized membrane protein YkvA (DUF1232 family)
MFSAITDYFYSDQTANKYTKDLSENEKSDMINNRFLPKLIKAAGYIPYIRDMLASYQYLLDKNKPAAIKALIAVPLLYFVVPVDAIPDILLALGYTDDMAVFAAALRMFASQIAQCHYDAADEILEHNEVKSEENILREAKD